MRDFEEDFEFENDVVVKTVKTYNVRIDSHRTVTFDPNCNAEREARIAAHTKRVQRDLTKNDAYY